LNTDYNRKSDQIEAARRAAHVTAEMEERGSNTPGLEDTVPRSSKASRIYRTEVADECRALALQAWCLRQDGRDLTGNHKRACQAVGLNPNRRVLEVRLARRPNADPSRAQKRALSATNPSAGAYTVAESFSHKFEQALKDYGGPREAADVMRTEDGASMPWPTSNDTTNEGEMVGENTAVDEQGVVFGVQNLGAYKFTSKRVNVPTELMEDDAFDLNTLLGEMLGERIGRGQEQEVHQRHRRERAARYRDRFEAREDCHPCHRDHGRRHHRLDSLR